MSTFDLPLDRVDAACLDALIANAIVEDRQLEYKEALPAEGDKHEFLADVTAFANSSGGDIIYGIRERRGPDQRPTGEPERIVGLSSLNDDAERQRLESLVRDGVAPRIAGLTLWLISRGEGLPCLLVRVPRSVAAPHVITLGGFRRFYGRTSAGKYPLDVYELRAAFVASETALDRLRRFRVDRVAKILAGDAPIDMGSGGAKAIFHLLPVSPPSDAWTRFREVEDQARGTWLTPMGGSTHDWRHNLDGFVVHTLRDAPSENSYVQLFRDGSLEAVSGGVVRAADPRFEQGYYGVNFERAVIGALTRFSELWSTIGVGAPVMLALTVSGLKGQRLVSSTQYRTDNVAVDRDPLFMPEAIVNTLDRPADVLLRPLLDVFWNAAGWFGSPHYGPEGRWRDPSR